VSYCTAQNLLDRFSEAELLQLTDKAQAGDLDYLVLDKAIADATAEIDSYLTAYALPLSPVPANFERLACDMARYYLYEDQMIDIVQERYKNAVRYLEQVASGKITLSVDASGSAPAVADGVEFVSETAVFSRDTLSGY